MSELNEHVQKIVRGEELDAAYQCVATHGDTAVAAILEAMHAGCPDGRHRNDWHCDLIAALTHIADVDPQPLIARITANAESGATLAHALAQSCHEEAIEALIVLLSHKRKEIRRAAVVGIGQKRPPQAVELLVPRLKDRSSHVRFCALEALAGYDDPRILQPLRELLIRGRLLVGEEMMAREAVERLAAITGPADLE